MKAVVGHEPGKGAPRRKHVTTLNHRVQPRARRENPKYRSSNPVVFPAGKSHMPGMPTINEVVGVGVGGAVGVAIGEGVGVGSLEWG